MAIKVFQYYDGIGDTELTVGGKVVRVSPGQTIEVDEADEVYSWIIQNRKWKMLNVVIAVLEKKNDALDLQQLKAIKGVGNSAAKQIMDHVKTWSELKAKGLDWAKSILKDDVAIALWKEVEVRGD